MSRTCKHKSCNRKKRCTMRKRGGAMSLRGGKRRGGAMSLRGGSVTAMRSAVASAMSPFTSNPATVGGKHRRSRRSRRH